MLRKTFGALKSYLANQKYRDVIKMAAAVVTGDKRHLDETSDGVSESESKRTKVEDDQKLLKRKVAMMMMYSGVGYMGMQRNVPFPTIEEDMLKALVDSGCIPEQHRESPHKMQFQRAARTDKGVSAAGQIVSLKISFHSSYSDSGSSELGTGSRQGLGAWAAIQGQWKLWPRNFKDDGLIDSLSEKFIHSNIPINPGHCNIPNLVEKINQNLPEKIRIIDIIRTTNNFNSKNSCSHRTYSYLIPTYAFTPVDEVTVQAYRVKDGVVDHVNQILSQYVGTHNFHNFTSGKKADDPSAKRYIISFECSQPFIRDDIEFAILTVKGQSFMLHQIRKMIGLMIAIVRGHTSVESITTAYQYPKFDIPKAPGLGLMLEYVHYDRYNIKFGDDGVHQKIQWQPYLNKMEEFKQEFIYSAMIEEEKRDKVMLDWLGTLFCHKFEAKTEDEVLSDQPSDMTRARHLVWYLVKARKNDQETTSSKQTSQMREINSTSTTKTENDVTAPTSSDEVANTNDVILTSIAKTSPEIMAIDTSANGNKTLDKMASTGT